MMIKVGALGIKSLRAWILTASLLVFSLSAQAAGLGRLNVKSALGEPLSAEIELFTAGKEMETLSARLAGPESFGRAGLVYTPTLADLSVSVEQRASGEYFLQITSKKSFNEPFVDLLIELTWAAGRISREFTALLDPPSVIADRARQKEAEAQVRAAPKVEAPQAEPMPAPGVDAAAPTPEAPATAESPTAPQTPTAEPPAAGASAEPEPIPEQQITGPTQTIGGTAPTMFDQSVKASKPVVVSGDEYGPVKRGDTLGKIARSVGVSGVSLDQMLVLLFRKNADAFSGRNMNRLKTGKILQLPTAEELADVTAAAARKEVRAQLRDWNAYREKLAGMNADAPPPEQVAEQSTSGKVTTTVKEPATAGAEAPKEVLKLSKAEAGAQGAQDQLRAKEEEALAREKELREANERIAKLDKQVKDLRDLLELKSSKVTPDKPATAPPVEAKVTPPPAPTPAAPVTSATPPQVESAPAPSVPPAAPPPQAAPATPPAKPRPVPPPPAPEPSLVDKIIGMVMDQATYIAAGVGALVLIGGLVFAMRKVRRRRESKSDTEDAGPATVVSRAVSAETPAVATRSAAVAASPDPDEVDPVAEAEIFLAYGRDAQAEELLTEALAGTPKRFEIHVKLLEIYAKRNDAKSFEKLARELQNGTGGAGPLWDQAVRLGIQVDPDNPRYAAGKTIAAQSNSAAETTLGPAENVDFDVGPGASGTNTTTDFDIGDAPSPNNQVFDPAGGTVRMPAMATSAPASSRSTAPASAMDFDVSGLAMGSPEPAKESSVMDFDVSGLAVGSPEAATPSSNVMDFDVSGLALGSEEPAAAKGGMDFDISGLTLGGPEASTRVEPGAAPPEFDLSGISLDLGAEPSARPPASNGKDDHWYDVQTKFDLAKAYQEMGDQDGAKDILKEVLQEGDAEQKSAAQSLLATLGA
jgi:pilus assembly protein FimV